MPGTEASLGLAQPLRSLVRAKFVEAEVNKALIFSRTELTTLQDKSGNTYQLRFCPTLAKKPIPAHNKPDSPPEQGNPKPKVNPFQNPSSDLLIASIPASKSTHNIILNKFPIIKNHFILATKDDKPQTDILEEDDLHLSYACAQAWTQHSPGSNQPASLFAFFNSGDNSGASQAHRHLQFLPVEAMRGEAEDTSKWTVLAQTMRTPVHPSLPLQHNPALPFIHYAVRLEAETAQSLYYKYNLLLRAAHAAVSNPGVPFHLLDIAGTSITHASPDDKRVLLSYNLALTTDVMAILPRRSDASIIPLPGASSTDTVSINGTILAGTLMVKEEKQWNLLRDQPDVLPDMIRNIGFPITNEDTLKL